MNYKTVLKYTRYNSGKHFLDSGFESGRHWQQPAPSKDEILLGTDPWDVSINLTKLLADTCEFDVIGAAFYRWHVGISQRWWTRRCHWGDWFELVPQYLKMQGYTQLARDNTYNAENDLSQNFVWEVWQRPDTFGLPDWIYADASEVLVVLYIHTGADVRGGYSKPLFCTYRGDYAVPLDNLVEWYLAPLPCEILSEEAESINDAGCLLSGYSQNPTSHATEDLGITWEDDCKYGDGYKVNCGNDEVVMIPSRPYAGQ